MYTLTVITSSERFIERNIPTLDAAHSKAKRALLWGYQHGTWDGSIIYVSAYHIQQVIISRDQLPLLLDDNSLLAQRRQL